MLLVNLSQDKYNSYVYLSSSLITSIKKCFQKEEKIILYLNKRGEYSSLICENCQHLYKCPNCDVSLNVHSTPEKLLCHLCGYSSDIVNKCDKCWKSSLKKIWIWTQQIEKSLKSILWNSIKIFRLDTDNVRNKSDKKNVLDNIEKANIIIWTKMITTGFNFDNVGLIAVILLEQELLVPKYNTEENLYQNIKQLIWRWNRVWKQTDIIIQSFIPENDIVQNIFSWNYKDFFLKSIEERKEFLYPPFTEIIEIEYRD